MNTGDNRSQDGTDPPVLDDVVIPGEFVGGEGNDADEQSSEAAFQLDEAMLRELATRIADEIHEQITPGLETIIDEIVEQSVRRIIETHSNELRNTIHERLYRTLPLLIEQAVRNAKDRDDGGS